VVVCDIVLADDRLAESYRYTGLNVLINCLKLFSRGFVVDAMHCVRKKDDIILIK